MINWKVRIKNPVWWAQTALAILAPMLAYAGVQAQEITSWPMLFSVMGQAFASPYICVTIVIALWNALNDPTTKGVGDSARALGYEKPN